MAELPITKPLLIAHRGLSARYPENTVAAIAAARREGCRAVEFDVQPTRDAALVVFHDEDLKRLTGADRRVADCTYDELRAFDLGRWKGREFAGERIPLLDEALAAWGEDGLVNIEIKAGGAAVAEALAARTGGIEARCLVSSFDWEALAAFRRAAPAADLAVLFEAGVWDAAMECAARLGAVALGADTWSVSENALRRATEAGLKVYVYTVNDGMLAQRLAGYGVAGVFSDDAPELSRAVGWPL